MRKIAVVGGGGHGKVVISILKKCTAFDVVGYADTIDRGPILGVPYLGDDDHLVSQVNLLCRDLALGLGYVAITTKRADRFEYFKRAGFSFPAIVSPGAIVNEDVSLGEGVVLMDGVVVNSGTKIGNIAILNTNCSVDHDCTIGESAHVCPGATLSGNVNLGDFSIVGAGGNVIHGVAICSKAFIGAGSVVTSDIKEAGTYVGVPSKLLRQT